jgi:hypothetical protein
MLNLNPTDANLVKHIDIDYIIGEIRKSLMNLNENFFDNEHIFYTFATTDDNIDDNVANDPDNGNKFNSYFFKFNIDLLYGNLNSIYLLIKSKLADGIRDELKVFLIDLSRYYSDKIRTLVECRATTASNNTNESDRTARCTYIDLVIGILNCTLGLIRQSIRVSDETDDTNNTDQQFIGIAADGAKAKDPSS